MKKIAILLLLVLFATVSLYAGDDPESPSADGLTKIFKKKEYRQDFRQCEWGMSKRKVKHREKSKLKVKDDKSLVYDGSLAGYSAMIVYDFIDNSLVAGRYILQEKHWERAGYIEAYTKLKDLLTKKYGEPLSDEVIWHNPQYRSSKPSWGLALSMGDLEYKVSWRTEYTDLEMKLWGDDMEIRHELTYKSRKDSGKDADQDIMENL